MMNVRPATTEDADAVLAITKWFATTFTIDEAAFADSFAVILLEPSACFLVAEANGELIGYVLAYEHPTLYANARVAWVDELAVNEEHRRSGIGRALMAAVEQWARERGDVAVTLATRRAAEFYKVLGYAESATYFQKLL